MIVPPYGPTAASTLAMAAAAGRSPHAGWRLHPARGPDDRPPVRAGRRIDAGDGSRSRTIALRAVAPSPDAEDPSSSGSSGGEAFGRALGRGACGQAEDGS